MPTRATNQIRRSSKDSRLKYGYQFHFITVLTSFVVATTSTLSLLLRRFEPPQILFQPVAS